MSHGRWISTGFLLTALGSLLLLTGCPKRPALAPEAAGSTGGLHGSTAGGGGPQPGSAPPGSAGGSGSVVATAPSPPGSAGSAGVPSPKEFVESPALKDIHFDFDRSTIRPEDATRLEGDAAWLKAHAKALVLIEGHADERGTSEYNLALGERRAKATRDSLISLGIEGSRITLLSYGEERPLCTARNERCWSQNRRAHFLVKGP